MASGLTPFFMCVKVGSGAGTEAVLGDSGGRPGDLRGGVRNLNLLETLRLPSGQGACSLLDCWPLSSSDTLAPEGLLQASWDLASKGRNGQSYSYPHKEYVQQGLQLPQISL